MVCPSPQPLPYWAISVVIFVFLAIISTGVLAGVKLFFTWLDYRGSHNNTQEVKPHLDDTASGNLELEQFSSAKDTTEASQGLSSYSVPAVTMNENVAYGLALRSNNAENLQADAPMVALNENVAYGAVLRSNDAGYIQVLGGEAERSSHQHSKDYLPTYEYVGSSESPVLPLPSGCHEIHEYECLPQLLPTSNTGKSGRGLLNHSGASEDYYI